MARIDHVLMRRKFRGCLLGGLIGDCFGAPFEGEQMSAGQKLVVEKYFNKLDGPYFKAPLKKYTDDTAMTKSVLKSLLDKPVPDYKLMAKLFVTEYYNDPKRGYGANVVAVFNKLRISKFDDIYKPAKEQFEGSGSYGNGAAMRIAPIALYYHNNCKKMIETAVKCSEITHAHKLGINGAVLQCLAIRLCLNMHPAEEISYEKFLYELIVGIRPLEESDDELDIEETSQYQHQLMKVMKLLHLQEQDENITDVQILQNLGNSVAALYSVPTAIYCFLRAQKEIPHIKADNKFRRTIHYAISLGGDTDTIANMAGSLAGAFFCEDYISENMKRHCEFGDEILEMADNLYTVTQPCKK